MEKALTTYIRTLPLRFPLRFVFVDDDNVRVVFRDADMTNGTNVNEDTGGESRDKDVQGCVWRADGRPRTPSPPWRLNEARQKTTVQKQKGETTTGVHKNNQEGKNRRQSSSGGSGGRGKRPYSPLQAVSKIIFFCARARSNVLPRDAPRESVALRDHCCCSDFVLQLRRT